MSNEDFNELTPEQNAALELIQNNPLLRTDSYAEKVVINGGRVASGIVVDMGNFLEARLAVLEADAAKVKLAAAEQKDLNAYKAAVVNSVAPHVEKYIEE